MISNMGPDIMISGQGPDVAISGLRPDVVISLYNDLICCGVRPGKMS